MSDLVDFIVWLKKKENKEISSSLVRSIGYYVYRFLEEQYKEKDQSVKDRTAN